MFLLFVLKLLVVLFLTNDVNFCHFRTFTNYEIEIMVGIVWDLQFLILKEDFSKSLKMLLYNSSPVARSQSLYSNSLSLSFPSNTYCRMIPNYSMFAESVVSSIKMVKSLNICFLLFVSHMRTIGSILIGSYYATWLCFFLIGRQIFHVVFSSTFLALRYSPRLNFY